MNAAKRCECDKPFAFRPDADDDGDGLEHCSKCTKLIPTTLAGFERLAGLGSRREPDSPGDVDTRHGKRELVPIGPFRTYMRRRIAECGYNAWKHDQGFGDGQYRSLLKYQKTINLQTVDKILCRDGYRATLADLYGVDA